MHSALSLPLDIKPFKRVDGVKSPFYVAEVHTVPHLLWTMDPILNCYTPVESTNHMDSFMSPLQWLQHLGILSRLSQLVECVHLCVWWGELHVQAGAPLLTLSFVHTQKDTHQAQTVTPTQNYFAADRRMKREDTEMISKITLNMINKCTLILAQTLNVIQGAVILIYSHIRAQKQSYGLATLTITGKAISGETRLLADTALNAIMRGMLCAEVVLVHFTLPVAVLEHYMTHLHI